MTDEKKNQIVKRMSQMNQALAGCGSIGYNALNAFKNDDMTGTMLALDSIGHMAKHATNFYVKIREEVLGVEKK